MIIFYPIGFENASSELINFKKLRFYGEGTMDFIYKKLPALFKNKQLFVFVFSMR